MINMNSMWKRFASVVLAFSLTSLASAAELDLPQGQVLLTISGKIARTNAAGEARLDRPMLAQLPQSSVTTLTPWTEKPHKYEGVLLTDLLHYLGASGQRIKARALNDYFTYLDLSELAHYPLLLATHVDGKQMRVRDKGPIWLVLPLTDFPELDEVKFHEKMIWQLRYLEVLE
ncbi:molybdopterin-binding oxidoreductase [Ferrimonas sp. YFM]|nr:molybdopterin-binding oxidoreductase [Ferrimonas sp. YFM]